MKILKSDDEKPMDSKLPEKEEKSEKPEHGPNGCCGGCGSQ